MHFFLAAALANLGKLEEAQVATQGGLTLDPAFTIRRFHLGGPERQSSVLEAAPAPNLHDAQGRGAGKIKSALSCQLAEQRLGLVQIERVEAFGEPAVDRCEKIAGLSPALPHKPTAFSISPASVQ